MKYLRTIPLMLAIALASALIVACGDDEGDGGNGGEATTRAASPTEDEGENGSPTDGAGDGNAVDLELAAENIAYAETELTAPAGADVTLVFDNDDEGIQHNFALFESEESEDALFSGDIITGIDTIDYEFKAPDDPGTYNYHCEVHPSQMTGDFIVE